MRAARPRARAEGPAREKKGGSRAHPSPRRYDFSRFEKKEQPEELFRIASNSRSSIFAGDSQLAIGDCERVVEDMGFPYIHFMHTYYYA